MTGNESECRGLEEVVMCCVVHICIKGSRALTAVELSSATGNCGEVITWATSQISGAEGREIGWKCKM